MRPLRRGRLRLLMREDRLSHPVDPAPPGARHAVLALDDDHSPDRQRRLTFGGVLLAASAVVFVIHALNYLYFFVDDEGIPFVFARHLLQGKGLVYNSFEG